MSKYSNEMYRLNTKHSLKYEKCLFKWHWGKFMVSWTFRSIWLIKKIKILGFVCVAAVFRELEFSLTCWPIPIILCLWERKSLLQSDLHMSGNRVFLWLHHFAGLHTPSHCSLDLSLFLKEPMHLMLRLTVCCIGHFTLATKSKETFIKAVFVLNFNCVNLG